MGNYLTEKVKAAFTKKWVWAFLIAALLSMVAVSVFYSKDRWASLGVVGTWVTGIFAGIIALSQYLDNVERKKILKNRCDFFVAMGVAKLSDQLISIMNFYCKCLINKDSKKINLDIFRELIEREGQLKKINIDYNLREFLDMDVDYYINELNIGLESLVDSLKFHVKKDSGVIFSKGVFLNFVEKIEKIRDIAFEIYPDSLIVDSFNEAIENSKKTISEK